MYNDHPVCVHHLAPPNKGGCAHQSTGASMLWVPSAQMAIARARTKASLSPLLALAPVPLCKRGTGLSTKDNKLFTEQTCGKRSDAMRSVTWVGC